MSDTDVSIPHYPTRSKGIEKTYCQQIKKFECLVQFKISKIPERINSQSSCKTSRLGEKSKTVLSIWKLKICNSLFISAL